MIEKGCVMVRGMVLEVVHSKYTVCHVDRRKTNELLGGGMKKFIKKRLN